MEYVLTLCSPPLAMPFPPLEVVMFVPTILLQSQPRLPMVHQLHQTQQQYCRTSLAMYFYVKLPRLLCSYSGSNSAAVASSS